jgi:hypothetical protein
VLTIYEEPAHPLARMIESSLAGEVAGDAFVVTVSIAELAEAFRAIVRCGSTLAAATRLAMNERHKSFDGPLSLDDVAARTVVEAIATGAGLRYRRDR